MLHDRPMNTVRATYEHLAHPWTHEELASRYHEARRRAERLSDDGRHDRPQTPVAMLASAVPALAALDVAIHVIHALPDMRERLPLDDLLLTAETNAALGVRRMHSALELDGVTHGYTADEWLPAVYEIAAGLLESARVDREPPSFIEVATAAVGWLSRAMVDLDQDAPDAAAAIIDGLGRVLALEVFAAVACDAPEPSP
jgi:hypothetical protein